MAEKSAELDALKAAIKRKTELVLERERVNDESYAVSKAATKDLDNASIKLWSSIKAVDQEIIELANA